MGKKVVVVGAVALGSKAACRLKRLMPDADVVILDRDQYVSYGGCGIPYYISGDVSDLSELQTTSFHMVRNPAFFKQVKNLDVRIASEVTAIDRAEKRVHVRGPGGDAYTLSYDALILGTGSKTRQLPIPGSDLANVSAVSNLHEAKAIKEQIASGAVGSAVIIGGGFIGIEVAEALADMWGIETSIIEIQDQIMPGVVDASMAGMAAAQMREKEVAVYLGERVEAIEGDGRVERVRTDKRTLEADLVVMAVGIEPWSDLARDAGLDIGPTGGIRVNTHFQTSDPDIYAGGDCVEVPHAITGQPAYFPLGSLANRQGRVIGSHIAGRAAAMKPAVGSFCVKVFDMALAGAGATCRQARECGFDAVSVQVGQLDRAHFYPTKELMFLELVVDKKTRRVLGIQGFGANGDAVVGRVNAVAAMLPYAPVVSDISNLELAYSPPFAAAMDIVNTLGNVAENMLDEIYLPVDADTFLALWAARETESVCFVDCRTQPDAKPYAEKFPGQWLSIPQEFLRDRIDEFPADRPIVLVCNTGARSYEAQLNLRELGITDTRSLQGGVAALKKCGEDPLVD